MSSEKVCRVCNLALPAHRFDTSRKICKTCRRAARTANERSNAPTPPVVAPLGAAPAPAPLPPLENAYAEAAKVREARNLRSEHRALVEENLRLKEELTAVTHVRAATPEIIVYGKAKDLRADAVPCALLSDAHVEEPVEKDSVHGLNEYNLEIARQRVAYFFRNFLRLSDMAARDSTVRTLYMGILGDLFSGWIHEELIANTLLAPADAATFVKGLLYEGIDFLLRESSYALVFDALPGNHGRLTDKMHFGDPTGTSLETVVYACVADRYEGNSRVQFNVAHHSEVRRTFFENFKVRLIHGYETSYQGGVGGLTVPLNKWIMRSDASMPASLTCLGHYHQFFDGGRFIVNGSVIGYNNYAKVKGFAYEDPMQAFFLLHARKGGRKALVAPIWLEEREQLLPEYVDVDVSEE